MQEKRTQADRRAATREALLAAAREEFVEHGFAAAATEAVVRRAGVTRGALYYHFPDKAALLALAKQTPVVEVAPEPKPDVFETYNLDYLKNMPPVEWLLDGILTRHGFAVLYGAPGESTSSQNTGG